VKRFKKLKVISLKDCGLLTKKIKGEDRRFS
jgi:hypothetical protein